MFTLYPLPGSNQVLFVNTKLQGSFLLGKFKLKSDDSGKEILIYSLVPMWADNIAKIVGQLEYIAQEHILNDFDFDDDYDSYVYKFVSENFKLANETLRADFSFSLIFR
jgi:hypothetical protein